MPLEHSRQTARDPTIPIFFTRYRAKSKKATKAIWLLQGGPGADSSAMVPLMKKLYLLYDKEIDIYTMDHRGTGKSNFLTCGLEDVRDCTPSLAAKNQDPRSFTVTNAAKDLHAAIKRFNQGQEVYLYGVSYGTFLVERYLSIYPKRIQGAILDGVVSQAGPNLDKQFTFVDWVKNHDEAGRRVLQACAGNALCSHHLPNPEQTLAELYEKVDALGHCSNGLSTLGVLWGILPFLPGTMSDKLKWLFGMFLKAQNTINIIPALIYRLDRCNRQDENFLKTFIDRLQKAFTSGLWSKLLRLDKSQSTLTHSMISYSELWQIPTPSKHDLEAAYNTTLFGNSNSDMVDAYCKISGGNDANCDNRVSDIGESLLYRRGLYYSKVARVPNKGGVMMLNGDLDPQTPSSSAITQFQLMFGNRRLFQFKYATHGVIANSAMASEREPTCGLLLIKSFVDNGGNPQVVDDSCMQRVNCDFSDERFWGRTSSFARNAQHEEEELDLDEFFDNFARKVTSRPVQLSNIKLD